MQIILKCFYSIFWDIIMQSKIHNSSIQLTSFTWLYSCITTISTKICNILFYIIYHIFSSLESFYHLNYFEVFTYMTPTKTSLVLPSNTYNFVLHFLIFFSLLSGTSGTILNRSGHPCLNLNLGEHIHYFTIFNCRLFYQ